MAAMKNAWGTFRNWRRGRPFGAGVCTLLAGLAVLFPPFASLKLGDVVITLKTLGGISATVIGAVLLVCGGAFLMRPQFRLAAGIVTLLLSLAAISAANLGTFLIATLLGIIGAALGISWSPTPRTEVAARRRRKRAAKRRAHDPPDGAEPSEVEPSGAEPSEVEPSAEERTGEIPPVRTSVRAGGGEQ
ncbi:DUF6114 domain-containing protein [Bounagaea algeriensis]